MILPSRHGQTRTISVCESENIVLGEQILLGAATPVKVISISVAHLTPCSGPFQNSKATVAEHDDDDNATITIHAVLNTFLFTQFTWRRHQIHLIEETDQRSCS